MALLLQRIEFLASSLKNLDFLILIRYHVFVEFLDKDGYIWINGGSVKLSLIKITLLVKKIALS